MADAYPPHWPEGWSRTSRPDSSQFRTGLNGALKNVRESLTKFANDSGKKVSSVVISSNVTLSEQNPPDAGVAIYFDWDNMSTCIAVDRYKKVEENLQAIHHCIQAKRTMLRHGGLNLVRAAFRGYAALPPPENLDKPLLWWEILKCSKEASPGAVRAAYKKARISAHPDGGGSSEKWHQVEAAWEQYQADKDAA